MFVDRKEAVSIVYMVMDERLFSDTILRVVRVSPTRFLVYDSYYLNGTNVFEKHSYSHRSSVLDELLEEFHHPDLIALQRPSDVLECEFPLRGYECYDDNPGSVGVFLPVKE